MKRFKRLLKTTLPIIGVFVTICLTVFIFPEILFAYKAEYKNFTLYSDRPLDNNIEPVLDEAITRISKSAINIPEQRYRLFICNDIWRLMIFSRKNYDK